MMKLKTLVWLGLSSWLAMTDAASGAPTAAGRQGPWPDVALVSGAPDALVLEFRPRFSSPRIHLMGGTAAYEPAFFGSAPPLSIIPGEPYLPARSFAVELRSTLNRVEIVEADYTDSTGVLIAPSPEMTEGEPDVETGTQAGTGYRAGFYRTSYEMSAEAYGRNEFVPRELAELVRVGETRGVILGDLVVAPVQYNAATRTLRTYTRIVLRITPVGTSPAAGRTVNDGMASGVAVNSSLSSLSSPSSPSTPAGRQGRPAGSMPRGSRTGGAKAGGSSVLASGNWYRMSIGAEGIYQISGQQLLNAGVPSSTNPASIRLFATGGEELPIDPLAAAPTDLTEITRTVVDAETPGALDGSDQIIFYARGVTGWKSSGGALSHYINRYHTTNYCWLTYGGAPGREMPQVATGPADFAATRAEGMLFREDEKTNLLLSGMDWLGQSFGPGDRFTYVHPLPGLDAGRPVTYRLAVGSRSSAQATFLFSEHGTAIGSPVVLAGTLIGNYFRKQLIEATADRSTAVSWSDGQSQLTLQYNTPSGGGTGFLDWYEIFYTRSLSAAADRFDFFADDTTGSVGYAVAGFSGGTIRVFDATRFDSVLSVPAAVSADTCRFTIDGAGPGARKRILMAGPSGYLSPGALTSMPNQDLGGSAAEAEMIILTPPAMAGAAGRLKTHREAAGPEAVSTLVVDVDQVYNEFGGGIPSPVALRNYLKRCYETWSAPPKYVLLMGDGDYDYRKISTSLPTFIPPWETEESFWPLETYSSDDFFALYDTSLRVKLAVGRLTARSSSEANTMVDKIIEYETSPQRSEWKTVATFVGDDGLAAADEPDNGFIHVDHAEAVAEMLTDLYDESKIYLFNYPTVTTASGRRKPAVNEAIRNAVNEGTFVLNYSGHGNPRLWAHEAVFVRETDIPLLENAGKYFILVAATCNYSHFDQVNDQSGGEILMAKPGAGAIATVSASRVVFVFQNLLFNQTLFTYLFETDSTGAVIRQRIGDAVFKTKQVRNGTNDQKYFLAGDPSLMPAFPRYFVGVDSINGIPAVAKVDLYSLGESSVAATVEGDTVPGGFSGTTQITVYDADRLETISYVPPFGQFSYRVSGNVIFRGQATVASNAVRASFIVPKDISFGTDNGKIAFYASNPRTDAAGFTRAIRFTGTDSTAAPDGEGPSIAIFFDSRSFRPGDQVSEAPLLIADLADSSGINTSGAGVGHRLEAWLDDQPASIDLTGHYSSKPDTYREGEVRYALGQMAAGSHRLRLRAWDTHNNSSTGESVFSVGGAAGLSLSNVFNYPNPFARSTYFTFDHNQTDPIDVEIKIYTVAGRQIGSLSDRALSERNIRIPWDGRDADGDALANGVYLYKIIARTTDGRHSSEVLGKLSINR